MTAFDCIIDLLIKAVDASVRHAHVSHKQHPYARLHAQAARESKRADAVGAQGRDWQERSTQRGDGLGVQAGSYPVVNTKVLFEKLEGIRRALEEGGGAGGASSYAVCASAARGLECLP